MPGVFVNIYRKDKSLLRNYTKLYYNNSCENVTANITENVCTNNFNIKSFRRV